MAQQLPLGDSTKDPDIEQAIVEPSLRRNRHAGSRVRPIGDRDHQRSGANQAAIEVQHHPGGAVPQSHP